MAKLKIVVGVLLLALSISAMPRNVERPESSSTHSLGYRRYHTTSRNAPSINNEGLKSRRISSGSKLHRRIHSSRPSMMDHVEGKAIFYKRMDENSRNNHADFQRKTGHTINLSEKTINDTITEVEEILKANPQIPRLSRQEMIDIIQNITKTNSSDKNEKNVISQSREEYIRSLMLVLPFNTNNLTESMIQELYTKQPITEIINTTPTNEWKIVVGEMSTEENESPTTIGPYTIPTDPSTGFVIRTLRTTTENPDLFTVSYTTPRAGLNNKPTKSSTISYTTPQEEVTDEPPKSSYISYNPPKEELKDKRPTFGERQRHRKTTTTTQNPITLIQEQEEAISRVSFTTRRPTTVFQFPDSTIAPVRAKPTTAPFVVTAASVTPSPFKRIPAEVTIPSSLKKDNILIRNDVKELLASIGLYPLDQPKIQNISTITTKTIVTTTPPPFPIEVKKGADTLTPEMQNLLKSFGLLDNEIPSNKNSNSNPIAQPHLFNPPPPEPTVDIGSYAAFKPLPIQSSASSISLNRARQKMGNDMKEFLSSFGLLPDEDDTPSPYRPPSSAREEKSRKTDFLSERRYEGKIDESSEEINENNSSSTTPLNLSIDTDILPDDMKDVLQSLGLAPSFVSNTNSNNMTTDDVTPSPIVSTTSFPITEPEITTASVDTTKRIDLEVAKITVDEVTANTTDEQTPTTSNNTSDDEINPTTEGHIFSPTDAVHNNEELEHLSKLLKTVRLFSNGTSQAEVESFLEDDAELLQQENGKHRKEKMGTLEQVKNPPDPLSFEELVDILNTAKNEVKRQQLQNDSKSDNSTTTSDETTTTSAIEASESGERNPSIEDLAASFGGSNGEEEDSELPLPPSRPNGLYFLLDWNSFLEVGEEQSRVNLRFAPKIGDSRNFLPVTVP